ncbi:MAG TPA: twin-arginine translocase TatA/TatE family subunit [Acidimicrobiales bacterium]|nr:twin-arginine translocase TatA/TatE family subunit [Acidimicrobiales bacterium]
MLSLSPAKLLVLLVIALIVLGPEKLPHVARQLGAAWGDFRRFRSRLESDVRGAFPDLPATHEVAQAVRSPLAFLDRLADEHEKSQTASTDGVVDHEITTPSSGPPAPVATNGNGGGNGVNSGDAGVAESVRGHSAEVGPLRPVVPDDPSMN